MNDTQTTLTAEAIDAMEAGREMDALVAERVFGGNVDPGKYMVVLPHGEDAYLTWPTFSTDIAAAWEVIDAMTHQGYSVVTQILSPKEPQSARIYTIGGRAISNSYGSTMPHAICRAALKATL